MKRLILAPLAALFGLLTVTVAPAAAQNTYPFQQPRFGLGYHTQLSPYLNMLNPGDAAANYYGRVLPEFQRREDRKQIYGSIQGITNLLPRRPGIMEGEFDAPMPSTGHPTAFGYTGSYFGGPNQARALSNPFGPRAGGRNAPQPAGSKPVKPRR
jgi:hypothetical protein